MSLRVQAQKMNPYLARSEFGDGCGEINPDIGKEESFERRGVISGELIQPKGERSHVSPSQRGPGFVVIVF